MINDYEKYSEEIKEMAKIAEEIRKKEAYKQELQKIARQELKQEALKVISKRLNTI